MPDPTPEQRRLQRRFEMKVLRFAAGHALLPEGCRVLVAVSGGADSTALLLSLVQISHRGGFELAVAHFDHGLRGTEVSEGEERLVAVLSESLGLPLVIGRGDIRNLASQSKQSIEMAARQARYAFLKQAAADAACDRVATGHTATDQAETVLMHVIRGAGLHGLTGMEPDAPWPTGGTPKLVRPLLKVTREETEAYCAAFGIQPIDDESNRSTDFERNRVRHELMPLLRSFNPRVEEAVVRLADAARADVEYLDAESINGIANDSTKNTIRYTWNKVMARHDALRRHGLRVAVGLLLGNTEDFAESHYLAMERLVFKGRTGDRISLPRNVTADRGRDFIKLTLGEPGPPPLPDGEATLPVPGEIRFGRLTAQSTTAKPSRRGIDSVELDAEAAGDSLMVRHRRNGDRFQPLGMAGTKKLQDFFIDAHIPSPDRDNVPIFENERGIIWVGGMRIAEWAKPQPGKPTVHLSYQHA